MTVVRSDQLSFAEMPGRRSADPFREDPGESSVRIVRLEPGRRRHAHRHPHSEEVVYVVSGTGVSWVDGTRTPLSAGDVVRIPARAAHATIPTTPMELVCVFPHPDFAQNIEETDIPVGEEET